MPDMPSKTSAPAGTHGTVGKPGLGSNDPYGPGSKK